MNHETPTQSISCVRRKSHLLLRVSVPCIPRSLNRVKRGVARRFVPFGAINSSQVPVSFKQIANASFSVLMVSYDLLLFTFATFRGHEYLWTRRSLIFNVQMSRSSCC